MRIQRRSLSRFKWHEVADGPHWPSRAAADKGDGQQLHIRLDTDKEEFCVSMTASEARDLMLFIADKLTVSI